MSENGNGIPKPEAIWIAFGIFAAAVAIAFGARQRTVLFWAIRLMVEAHERRERVIVFGAQRNHRRALSSAIRGGVAWLKRFIVEADDGEGPARP